MPTTTKPNGTARLGRPPKADKEQWIQVTCVLRRDTVESLRAGADSKHFGEFLQAHLNKYPPPSREQYLSMSQNVPYYTMVKRNKRVPTLMAAGSLNREAKKLARERARRERMSPEERAWDDAIRDIGHRVYDRT